MGALIPVLPFSNERLIHFLATNGSLTIDSLMNQLRLCRAVLSLASVCLWDGLLTIQAAAQEIKWSIPADGGTPRDTNRIEQVGPREFRVRASFEEGGQSVLRHAVS